MNSALSICLLIFYVKLEFIKPVKVTKSFLKKTSQNRVNGYFWEIFTTHFTLLKRPTLNVPSVSWI